MTSTVSGLISRFERWTQTSQVGKKTAGEMNIKLKPERRTGDLDTSDL
jgi:hypothetical protein